MKETSDCSDDPTLCCRDVNEFLTAYVEEGLDPSVRSRFEAHLGSCSKCTEYFDQYRTTVQMVHETDEIPSPPDVLVDRTLQFLRAHYRSSPDGRQA